jgi:hypothetical protein
MAYAKQLITYLHLENPSFKSLLDKYKNDYEGLRIFTKIKIKGVPEDYIEIDDNDYLVSKGDKYWFTHWKEHQMAATQDAYWATIGGLKGAYKAAHFKIRVFISPDKYQKYLQEKGQKELAKALKKKMDDKKDINLIKVPEGYTLVTDLNYIIKQNDKYVLGEGLNGRNTNLNTIGCGGNGYYSTSIGRTYEWAQRDCACYDGIIIFSQGEVKPRFECARGFPWGY